MIHKPDIIFLKNYPTFRAICGFSNFVVPLSVPSVATTQSPLVAPTTASNCSNSAASRRRLVLQLSALLCQKRGRHLISAVLSLPRHFVNCCWHCCHCDELLTSTPAPWTSCWPACWACLSLLPPVVSARRRFEVAVCNIPPAFFTVKEYQAVQTW